MIIRLTVHDNDFEGALKGFFSAGLYGALKYIAKSITRKEDPSNEELIEYRAISIQCDDFLDKIMKNKPFSEEEKTAFYQLLNRSYDYYLKSLYPEDYKYLTENKDLSIINSVEDKDENGEVLYYFPINNTYIIM